MDYKKKVEEVRKWMCEQMQAEAETHGRVSEELKSLDILLSKDEDRLGGPETQLLMTEDMVLRAIRCDAKFLTLDIETTGLDPWYGDQITCICAKTYWTEVWFEQAALMGEGELLTVFSTWLFANFDPESTFIVTKNGRMFDIPFILARASLCREKETENRRYSQAGNLKCVRGITQYGHFDLQFITRRWVSLNELAKILGCEMKSGSGLNAVKLWYERKYDELIAYCKDDVQITEQTFINWLLVRGVKI